jgi:tetratricopeptide (TPR) repeat protein
LTATSKHGVKRWAFVLTFLLGTPALLIWLSQPFLDMSHATYLTAAKDYQGAIKALNRAIAFNGLLSEPYVKRGYCWEMLKQPEKALADYDRAIAMNPNDWAAYNNRASLTQGKNPKQALMDATHAVDLCGDCPQAYETRAAIYAETKDDERALADLDKAIELDPKKAGAYFSRSELLYRLKRGEDAQRDLERAHELGGTEEFQLYPPPKDGE